MKQIRRTKSWTALAVLVCLLTSLSTGCLGYSRSAKRGAYVGNSFLIAAGGAALGYGIATYAKSECSAANASCVNEASPVSGFSVVGAALVIGGIVGIILTGTRPLAKNLTR